MSRLFSSSTAGPISTEDHRPGIITIPSLRGDAEGEPSVNWLNRRAAVRAEKGQSQGKFIGPAAAPEQIERREPRRRVPQTALAGYADLGISFRCVVRDRSASGARLKLPEGLIVPREFWFIDVAAGRGVSSHRCMEPLSRRRREAVEFT